MTPKRFMLIAGEASGDMLAAELVGELRAGMMRHYTYSANAQPLDADLAPRFFGAGGPRMAEAGVDLAFDLTQHSVVGLSGPIKHFLRLKRIFDQLVALAVEREPHVIIGVDFSEFNTRFAAAIKRHVIARRGTFNNWEPKIVRYVSPQAWASREGRVYQMQENLDLLLSIIPFEKAWYAARVPKLRVEFVGYPMFDRHLNTKIAARDAEYVPTVVLLPGSRKSELQRHFPVMLEAFGKIRDAMPSVRAIAILPNETLAGMARAQLASSPGTANSALRIQVGGLSEVLIQATVAIASTGTVTMECAYFGVPTVTLYKASWWEYEIVRRLIKVKWLTMANILANDPVFPEFIQHAASPENLSRAALEFLRDESCRENVKARLKEIIAPFGGRRASRNAAEAILKLL